MEIISAFGEYYFSQVESMKNNFKKIILISILLAGFLGLGIFVIQRKSLTIEPNTIAAKNLEFEIKAETSNKLETIDILFLGDMMFDRYIRQVSQQRGYNFPFGKLTELLQRNDLVVGNLEGPITDNISLSVNSKVGEKNNYIFTFDPQVSKVLAEQNIKLVNLGNNHILNFADSGVETTKKYLMQEGIDFFGDPNSESSRLAIKDIKNRKIAFVSYNQFEIGAAGKTFADLNAANSEADIIIVYTHWGREYMSEPDEKERILARQFIDSGADLIIGSHPHVVQSKEEYKDKMIYYSLGNFIFDQYFEPETKEGLMVQVQLDAENIMNFTEHEIQMRNNGQSLSLQ